MHANFKIMEQRENFVIIKDIGPWDKHISVTNDAEWVVQRLFRDNDIIEGQKLFYIDSEGQADEILIENGQFKGFAPGK
jgi:hypothetical protein